MLSRLVPSGYQSVRLALVSSVSGNEMKVPPPFSMNSAKTLRIVYFARPAGEKAVVRCSPRWSDLLPPTEMGGA